MAGIILWNYFSECLNKTSTTFTTNAAIFGKVYFPRTIMPLSNVITNLIRFIIQLIMFLGFYFYYLYIGVNVRPNIYAFLMPVLLLIMALQGLGWGLIISALTTKYRDLTFLVSFGVQLLMYATPIIYPLSAIPEKYKIYILANPLSSVIETFRFSFLGKGSFSPWLLSYSILSTIVVVFLGLIIFNRVEKTFMDTV